jgi:phosphoserine phosphatase RsbU/P
MSEKVLIVDDSMVNRKLLNVILAKAGYEAAEAVDGEDALARVFEFMPDLVLLDVMMPKMDGYEVCAALKEDGRTSDVPIIFLSAKSDVEDKIRGLDVGGVDYITKPFDQGEVLARVRNQLKIRSLTQQIMRAHEQLLAKQKRIDEDLKAAAGIQESLLPESDPGVKNIDFAWRYKTCDEIGGDIFNVMRLDEEHLGIYMLDVSGHGVPAALVTVSAHRSLSPQTGFVAKRRLVVPPYYEIVSPREVLRHLDQEYPIERFDKFFTIVYLVLSFKTGLLRYSNAAHPHPVLIRADGSLEALDKGGTIIGLGGSLAFEEEEKQLHPGDKLILFTDGLIECENDQGEFYGDERFTSLLQELRHEPMGGILDGILDSLTSFMASRKPQDDISLLGIGFKEWSG